MPSTVDYEAVHALIEGDDPDAWKVAANLVKEHPKDWKAILLAGFAALKKEQHGISLLLLKEANRINPGSTELLNNIGLCQLGVHETEEAKESLRQALKIDPSNW